MQILNRALGFENATSTLSILALNTSNSPFQKTAPLPGKNGTVYTLLPL